MTENNQAVSGSPTTHPCSGGFGDLDLSEEMQASVRCLGFDLPSPIQKEAIPVIQEGFDVVGQSQTGSGKTAAFCIPIVEKISTKKIKRLLSLAHNIGGR